MNINQKRFIILLLISLFIGGLVPTILFSCNFDIVENIKISMDMYMIIKLKNIFVNMVLIQPQIVMNYMFMQAIILTIHYLHLHVMLYLMI